MCLALALLAVTACTDETDYIGQNPQQGTERLTGITLTAVPEAGSLDTRALGDVDDKKNYATISDVWILEFEKSGGGIVCDPQFCTADKLKQPISVIMPPEGKTYVFVAIANTGHILSEMERLLLSIHSLDDLKNVYGTVISLKDTYRQVTPDDGTSYADLMMSGYTEVTASEGTNSEIEYEGLTDDNLAINLYRNVAKLTVNIQNAASSGVKVQSVQVRNVSGKLFYADHLWGYPFNGGTDESWYDNNPVPVAANTVFVDYTVDDCVVEQGGSGSLTYYLPRNCRGSDSRSANAWVKNLYATGEREKSTYVEIMAAKLDDNNEVTTPLRYRFYLGEDMRTDFNVMPNHHYTLTVNIQNSGSELDARVEDLDVITLGEANAYIVNPIVGTAQSVYKLPVAVRANRFWQEGQGGYIQTAGDNQTTWVAEVIWQDANSPLIEFCNEPGNDVSHITDGHSYTGQGNDPLCFKPKQGAKGNVLIGVRKKGNDNNKAYLWSWHLWITDYNPDQVGATDDDHIYEVPGGNVHRYDDGVGGLNYDDQYTYNLWSSMDKYATSYIMDRNLGARSVTRTDGYQQTGGLCYQYGRKDPFPLYLDGTKTVLYDIQGNALSGVTGSPFAGVTADDYIKAMSVNGVTSVAVAVQKPYVFYCIGEGNWASDSNTSSSVLWNNPVAYNNISPDKSLFDPCPYGWKLPENGTWSIFSVSGVNNYTVPNASGTWNQGFDFYISSSSEAGAPTAFYPACGYRMNVNGAVADNGNYGFYWSATTNSAARGRFLYIRSNYVNPQNTYGCAYGFPVRCVKEKVK